MSDSSFISQAYVDLTEVDKALADVGDRGKHMAPAFRALRRPLRGDQTSHAKRAEGPSGAWPARAAVTEERRRSRNKRVRKTKAMSTIAIGRFKQRSTPKALLGRLPRAIRVTTGDLWIRGTSWATFGLAHNRGSMVGHHRAVRLPKREFLWLSDSFLDECKVVLANHIVKGWKR